jgi:hypothetical protein
MASMQLAQPDEAYLPVRMELMRRYGDLAPGDPARVAGALLQLVASPRPPRRLLLGDGDYDAVVDAYRRRIDEWASWEAVSRAAG